jgi:hypothetical protein
VPATVTYYRERGYGNIGRGGATEGILVIMITALIIKLLAVVLTGRRQPSP